MFFNRLPDKTLKNIKVSVHLSVVYISNLGQGPFNCYVTQWGWVSNFLEKSVTKVYGSMLLALWGGGWVSIFPERKCYVTLEWPLRHTPVAGHTLTLHWRCSILDEARTGQQSNHVLKTLEATFCQDLRTRATHRLMYIHSHVFVARVYR